MERHGFGLQCDGRGTGWLLVGAPLAQFNITTVEVGVSGRRIRFLGTAAVHIKVVLQFKLRCGLDTRTCREKGVQKRSQVVLSEILSLII